MDKFPTDPFKKAVFFKKLGDKERTIRFLSEAIRTDPINKEILELAEKVMNPKILEAYEESLGDLIDNGKSMDEAYFLLGKLTIEYSPNFKKGLHYLKIARGLNDKFSGFSQAAEFIQWLLTGHTLQSNLNEISENDEEEKMLVRGILNNEKIHSTNKVIAIEYAIEKGKDFLKKIEDLLVKSCKNEDWRIRLSSIKALGYLENAEYSDMIKDLIGNENERSNLPWYYWSIYNITGDPTYFDSVESLTRDKDPTVRLNAAMVLGMCKSDKAIDSLKKILYSEEPFTGTGLWSKEQAAKILLQYDDEKAAKVVREAELLSTNLDTKLAARKAIEEKNAEENKKRI